MPVNDPIGDFVDDPPFGASLLLLEVREDQQDPVMKKGAVPILLSLIGTP